MKQTRVVYLNQSEGHLNFTIEAGLYKVVLQSFCFRYFDNPQLYRLQIDGLDLGSGHHPLLVNHSGYSHINAHYITTYLHPRNTYRVVDLNGAPANFTANGQELTLIFQLERLS